MFGFQKKNTVVLTVNKMHCVNCAKKVTNIVSALDGVSKVNVNLEEKSVNITCNDKFDLEKAKEAINTAGFEVVS